MEDSEGTEEFIYKATMGMHIENRLMDMRTGK